MNERHRWAIHREHVEEGFDSQLARMDVYCERCGERRLMWRGIDLQSLPDLCPEAPMFPSLAQLLRLQVGERVTSDDARRRFNSQEAQQ